MHFPNPNKCNNNDNPNDEIKIVSIEIKNILRTMYDALLWMWHLILGKKFDSKRYCHQVSNIDIHFICMFMQLKNTHTLQLITIISNLMMIF